MNNIARIGSAVEKFGRAVVPGQREYLARREAERPDMAWHSDYLALAGPDVYAARTIEEAKIANARAREAQRELPILGRTVGWVAALGAGLWLTRARKSS